MASRHWQLSRELGVTYNTAWKLKHKLLQVMHERNQGETLTGETLSGRIEIDDAYLGGERPTQQWSAIANMRSAIETGSEVKKCSLAVIGKVSAPDSGIGE